MSWLVGKRWTLDNVAGCPSAPAPSGCLGLSTSRIPCRSIADLPAARLATATPFSTVPTFCTVPTFSTVTPFCTPFSTVPTFSTTTPFSTVPTFSTTTPFSTTTSFLQDSGDASLAGQLQPGLTPLAKCLGWYSQQLAGVHRHQKRKPLGSH